MADNSEILCPTTGGVCPALANLHELYVGNKDRVDHDTATLDRIKLNARRAEYVGRAVMSNCSGVTEARTCPVRDDMDVSPIRKSLVSVVRSMLGARKTTQLHFT